jgi:hypothetical protein
MQSYEMQEVITPSSDALISEPQTRYLISDTLMCVSAQRATAWLSSKLCIPNLLTHEYENAGSNLQALAE